MKKISKGINLHLDEARDGRCLQQEAQEALIEGSKLRSPAALSASWKACLSGPLLAFSSTSRALLQISYLLFRRHCSLGVGTPVAS